MTSSCSFINFYLYQICLNLSLSKTNGQITLIYFINWVITLIQFSFKYLKVLQIFVSIFHSQALLLHNITSEVTLSYALKYFSVSSSNNEVFCIDTITTDCNILQSKLITMTLSFYTNPERGLKV